MFAKLPRSFAKPRQSAPRAHAWRFVGKSPACAGFPRLLRGLWTLANAAGFRRSCYAELLCFLPFHGRSRGWRMGGDSNPRCLSAHTLSRRAQSTTLSPIRDNLPPPLNLTLGLVKLSG